VEEVRCEPGTDHRADDESAERERRGDQAALEAGECRESDDRERNPVGAGHRARFVAPPVDPGKPCAR
jgi:hypothetical protein